MEEKNRNLIVQLTGELDHHTVEGARDKIDRAFARVNAKNIIFDFSGLDFMDSSGIGMVIGRYRQIENQGGRVAAVGVSPEFGRIFEISGLQKLMPCYKDVDEAISRMK